LSHDTVSASTSLSSHRCNYDNCIG